MGDVRADGGAGEARLAPHVTTGEWQTFELRMRRRRAERCVAQADERLTLDDVDGAEAALAEARALAPDLDGLSNVAVRIEAARHPAGWIFLDPVAIAGIDAPLPSAAPSARAGADLSIGNEPTLLWSSPAARPAARSMAGRALAVLAIVGCAGTGGWIFGARALDASTVGTARLYVDAGLRQSRVLVATLSHSFGRSAVVGRDEGVTAATPATSAATNTDTSNTSAAPSPTPEASVPLSADAPAPASSAASSRGDARPPTMATRVQGPTVEVRSIPLKEQPSVERASVERGPSPSIPTVAALVAPAPAPPAPAPPAIDRVSALPVEPPAAPAAEPEVRTNDKTAEEAGAAIAAARAADDQSIRRVLAEYATAFNRLDAAAARAVWPAVQEPALAHAFEGLTRQQITLETCRVDLDGDAARASCVGSASWEPKVGGGSFNARRGWRFDLRKADGTWQIATARVSNQ